MSERVILFLPTGRVSAYRWLRVAGDAIVARGEGVPVPDLPVVAVAPAEDVALHWAELPARSLAQATAAARLLLAEAALTPIAELHVAVGEEADRADRPIAAVALATMRNWLASLANHQVAPVAVLPAPLLLPRPAQGFVRGDFGGDAVLRGETSGFADEPGLSDIVTQGAPVQTLDAGELERAVVAATAAPVLDLLQGPFAPRDRAAFDWRLLRRAAWLAAAALALTLAINLVQIIKFEIAADALERRADLLARQGLPRGETVSDAGRQLAARLARMRGAGLGFTQTAAAVFAAIRAVPGTELRALSFDATGKLRITLVTQTEGQITDIIARLHGAGLAPSAGQFSGTPGRLQGELTVTPR